MLKFAYGAIKAGIECRDNGRRQGRWEEIKNYELKGRAEEVTACSEKEQAIGNWEFKNRQRDEDREKPACFTPSRLEVVGRGSSEVRVSERGTENPERPDRYANPEDRPCMVDANE